MKRIPSLVLLVLAIACGAPPPGPTPGVGEEKGKEGAGSATPAGGQVACGQKLSDTREDGNPMPEDALVIDQKPHDLDYELGKFGGNLVAPTFTDAKTFNWIVSNEQSTSDIVHRALADLVHVNRHTQEPELALAKKYEIAPDGRSMTVWLRKGILWSDGEPFDADDVVFTWNTLFDPAVRSPQADLLTIDGKPITIQKVDDHTVRLDFPTTVAVPDRLLDSIFIMPEHKLAASVKAGSFSAEWGVGMAPADFVTLGPFKLKQYEQGVKTVLERNPHYWKYDKSKRRLPYLDEITFLWVPDRNSERLRYENLESHVYNQVRHEDYADIKKLEAVKDWTVYDLGPSLSTQFFWFNQNAASGATVGDKSYMVFPGGEVREQSRVVEGEEKAKVLAAKPRPFVDPVKLAWFRDDRFRQAVSYALNREGIIRSVFFGLGEPLYASTSPGSKNWYNPDVKKYTYDIEKAKQLLDEAGYRDTDGDGIREDAGKHPIAFTLTTNTGNEQRQKIGNIVKEDLARIGFQVDFKPMDFNAFITKLSSTFDWDAAILSLGGGDVDPSGAANVLKSAGYTHMWYPFQPTPSTEQERRIDELMVTIQTSQDPAVRKKADGEIQAIMAEAQFMNYTLCHREIASVRNCVGNLRPAVMDHFTLHNQEMLYFKY